MNFMEKGITDIVRQYLDENGGPGGQVTQNRNECIFLLSQYLNWYNNNEPMKEPYHICYIGRGDHEDNTVDYTAAMQKYGILKKYDDQQLMLFKE